MWCLRQFCGAISSANETPFVYRRIHHRHSARSRCRQRCRKLPLPPAGASSAQEEPPAITLGSLVTKLWGSHLGIGFWSFLGLSPPVPALIWWRWRKLNSFLGRSSNVCEVRTVASSSVCCPYLANETTRSSVTSLLRQTAL